MEYTVYELSWMFFLYSFLGWCLEVAYAAAGKKAFVNRGFLNGVLCPAYGFATVFTAVFMAPLREEWFYLFLGCMIVGTVTELVTGLLLEKVFHLRLWDYTDKKYHAGSYICLANSIAWGVLGLVNLKFFNPLFVAIVRKVPYLPGIAALLLLVMVLAADVVMTVGVLCKAIHPNQAMSEIAEGLSQASRSLRVVITNQVNRRMERAFPRLEKEGARTEEEKQKLMRQKAVFAYGCSFHKVVWVFFWGAFLGDVIETVFCRFSMGRWMSRSSLVYGAFSLVWGIGFSGATMLLYRYREREDRYIFLAGTLLGGAFEYVCSVFTEIAFGAVFWDYSKIPFNLGGRINLLFCFFWGIVAWVWMKRLYPLVSKWIEKVPMKLGKGLTWLMIVFMVWDMGISGAALGRYGERAQGIPAGNEAEAWIDRQFPDQRMEQIYPSAKMAGEWGEDAEGRNVD